MEKTRKNSGYWDIIDGIVKEIAYSDYEILTKREISLIKKYVQDNCAISSKNSVKGFGCEFDTTISIISIAFTAVDIFVSLYIYKRQNKEKTLSKQEITDIVNEIGLRISQEAFEVINHRFELLEKSVERKYDDIKASLYTPSEQIKKNTGIKSNYNEESASLEEDKSDT